MYIPVIYYHSIAPQKNPGWIKNYLTLELEFFEAQIKFLYDNNYQTIFLDEYFELVKDRKHHKKKYVCITFDDGFVDNWIYAFPILQKYNFKATIFVSPEFIDLKSSIRKTLNDYWNGRATIDSIKKWGYLSWEEMSVMEATGLIDIQSHTMSHAELFTSERIVDFHHPGSQFLYPIGNLFPEKKPYYIEDVGFEKLLPYGYPFFEYTSSVIARKVEINPDFIADVVEGLKGTNWDSPYKFDDLRRQIEPLYLDYLEREQVVLKKETDQEYDDRLMYELKSSKDLIEAKLKKQVNYLCWPNDDYNDYTHMRAKEIGYKGSVVVLGKNKKCASDRFDRISIASMRKDKLTSKVKAKMKIKGYHTTFPINYIYAAMQKNNKGY